MSPKGSWRSHGTQHFKKLRLNLDIFTAKLCHGKGVMQDCAAGARYATFFLSPCCMLPFPSTFDQLSPARWYLKKFPITPYRVDGIPKKNPGSTRYPSTHRPGYLSRWVDGSMEKKKKGGQKHGLMGRWLGWGLDEKSELKKKSSDTKKGVTLIKLDSYSRQLILITRLEKGGKIIFVERSQKQCMRSEFWRK